MKIEFTDKHNDIILKLEDASKSITDYISKNKKSNFFLYNKLIRHSDLVTTGKATKKGRLQDNILYYLSIKEMEYIEVQENRKFETARQSSIGISKGFWEKLGMPNPRDNRKNKNESNESNKFKKINNYAKVFLVKDSLKYFKSDYTLKTLNKLNKTIQKDKWDKITMDISEDARPFISIVLSQSVHGIGVKEDEEFHKLRHNIFLNDIIYFLIEEKTDVNEKNLFLILQKNPSFFTINYEGTQWNEYMSERINNNNGDTKVMTSVAVRKYQSKWREELVREVKNYSAIKNKVFCILSGIEGDYNDIGTLFLASHIKSYADSNDEEKYDLNNGLLLSANMDALFDKHLITINQSKELVVSKIISKDEKLYNDLHFKKNIFSGLLNKKRMEYLKVHETIFNEKEKER